MKRKLSLVLILTTLILLAFVTNSFAMKSKNFTIHEKLLKMKGDFKIIGEVTLKPGEEKSFSTYSFKPVTIDFSTSLTEKDLTKCKSEGIGIKKVSNLKYYLKDYFGASMDVLPEDGVVNISVKNFEKFPITVKLYQLDFKA